MLYLCIGLKTLLEVMSEKYRQYTGPISSNERLEFLGDAVLEFLTTYISYFSAWVFKLYLVWGFKSTPADTTWLTHPSQLQPLFFHTTAFLNAQSMFSRALEMLLHIPSSICTELGLSVPTLPKSAYAIYTCLYAVLKFVFGYTCSQKLTKLWCAYSFDLTGCQDIIIVYL